MNMFGTGYGMILFWALLIVGVVVLVGWVARRDQTPREGNSPAEILRRRYASGEISKEQFEQMKRDLSQR
jgi:putative membrane protein